MENRKMQIERITNDYIGDEIMRYTVYWKQNMDGVEKHQVTSIYIYIYGNSLVNKIELYTYMEKPTTAYIFHNKERSSCTFHQQKMLVIFLKRIFGL